MTASDLLSENSETGNSVSEKEAELLVFFCVF